MRKKLILLIVLIGIMGFIYYMSAQPVLQSGEMSFGVDRWVCSHFVDGFESMTPQEQEAMVMSLDFWVRKSAHFTEYMVLGVMLMLAADMFRAGRRAKADSRSQAGRRAKADSRSQAGRRAKADSRSQVSSRNRTQDNDRRIGRKGDAAMAIVVGVVYAVFDEVHQYFVPGRACQLRDMIIDICGVSAGVLIALCALWIIRKLKRSKY